MGVPYPGPQVHYCARCNADRWHDVSTSAVRVGMGTDYVPTSFSCQACRHPSDARAACQHSPVCFVPPAARGANPPPGFPTAPARQGHRRMLLWGIPALVAALVLVLCAGYAVIRFAHSGDDNAAGQPTTGPSAPCVLAYQTEETCQSTDPKVDLAAVWLSDATACTFDLAIQWADGSPVQAVTVPGGPTGQTLVASHTYAQPGTYAIVATTTVDSGNCQGLDGHYRFTLTPS